MRAGPLVLVCISAAACGGGPAAPPEVRAVLVVTVDGLPRDGLGDSRRMPLISARAAGPDWRAGALFANAESSAGALASLWTASTVARHGLRAAGAAHEHGLDELAPPTLAARLAGAGWSSAAFLPLPWLGRDFSALGAAFERETAPPARRGAAWTRAADLAPQVLEELESRADGERPYIVWVHLADTRRSLAARSPRLAVALATRLEPFAGALPDVAEALELASSDPRAALRELEDGAGRRRGSPEQAALEAALLDAGLAEVDETVDALVRALERDARWADTLVCIAGTGGSGRGLTPQRLATAYALRLPDWLRAEQVGRALPLTQVELGRELAALLNAIDPVAEPVSAKPVGDAALHTALGVRPGTVAWLERGSSGGPRLVVLDGLERAAVHAWPAGGVLTDAEPPDRRARLRHTAGARVTVELAPGAGPLELQIESPLGELLAIELEDLAQPGAGEARTHRTSERICAGHLSGAGTLVAYTTRAIPELALALTLEGRAPGADEIACDGVALDALPRPVLLRRRGEEWGEDSELSWTVDVERPSARNDWRVRVAAAPGTSVELLAQVWPVGRTGGLELAPTPPDSEGVVRSEHLRGRSDRLQLNGSGSLDALLVLDGARPELALAVAVGGRPISTREIRFRGTHLDPERLNLVLDVGAWQKRAPGGMHAETPIRIDWTAMDTAAPIPRRGPRALGPGARELLSSLPQDD